MKLFYSLSKNSSHALDFIFIYLFISESVSPCSDLVGIQFVDEVGVQLKNTNQFVPLGVQKVKAHAIRMSWISLFLILPPPCLLCVCE